MFLIEALEFNKIQVLCFVVVLNMNIKEQEYIPKCTEGNLKEHIIHHALSCNSQGPKQYTIFFGEQK